MRKPRRRKLKYHAFLSYSHKDEAIADWLHEEIEAFRVPTSLVGRLAENGPIPKRLTPIFRDEHELAAADDLGDEIEAALASAQVLIVLCSPNAAQSHWTNAEIAAFKRSRPDGCILAAIAAGEPFASDIAGREDEECFPPALRQKYDRRGRPTGKRAEPLAADLRDTGDGRRMGFLKLVAGMLGVGLDELVQRETTQRHRRLAWLTAASLGGMAVTSGLAITAIQARDSARDQRREAEGLVAFMLGDLKDKLEPIGRLDALDGVGSRVLAYYSKQDAGELSDAGLLQRAQALSLSAQVAFLRGDSDTAEKLYRQAMAGTGEAVRRNPDDPQRLFEHAQNVFWIGELARGRGRNGEAETAYREYKRLAGAMVAIEPDNLRWRMETLYANENLGIVLYAQRRFAEAARQFEDALRPMESIASIDRPNAEYQKELSNVLAWLADAQRAQGRFEVAIELRRRQIAFLNSLIAGGSANVQFRQQLIPARQALGRLLFDTGAAGAGLAELRAAVDQGLQLMPIEPANRYWIELTAGARLALADYLVTARQNDAARNEVSAGCGLANDLISRDRSVADWRDLAEACLTVRARLAMAAGSYPQALALAERLLSSVRAGRESNVIEKQYRMARAYRLIGDIHDRSGARDRALAAWTEGFSQLPRNIAERPWEMSERAEFLKRLERTDEAMPIINRLVAIGYR